MILSMLQTQTPAPAPAPSQPPTEAPAAEITSTTDALNQMRLKRREEASASSESKSATKAPPTLHELEAEAAPFEEVLEEVIPEKRGEAGTICLVIFALLYFLVRIKYTRKLFVFFVSLWI